MVLWGHSCTRVHAAVRVVIIIMDFISSPTFLQAHELGGRLSVQDLSQAIWASAHVNSPAFVASSLVPAVPTVSKVPTAPPVPTAPAAPTAACARNDRKRKPFAQAVDDEQPRPSRSRIQQGAAASGGRRSTRNK